MPTDDPDDGGSALRGLLWALAVMAAVCGALLALRPSRDRAADPLPCAEAERLIGDMAILGEVPTVLGRTLGGGGLAITANPDTRTWTVLTIDADGIACVGASGVLLTILIPETGDPT